MTRLEGIVVSQYCADELKSTPERATKRGDVMKGITVEGKFFTGISPEKFNEVLAGKPGICHSEGADGKYHIYNCPGKWAIYDDIRKNDLCRDMSGETRSLSGQWSVFTHHSFPEWMLFATWAEYDRAQEKKEMVELEKKNRELTEEIRNIKDILREIAGINNAGGPGSRRAVRELIDSCR